MTTIESFDTVSRRLFSVHSCDPCRSRKIKCCKSAGQPTCVMCVKNRTQCTYEARDQYLAKRQSIVASHIASSGGVGNSTYSLGVSSITSFNATVTPSAQTPTQAAPPVSASNPNDPPAAWMPHFIELFFKHYSASFPFMSYENVVFSFLRSSLSPLLSNAIAGLAARHSSTMPQLAAVDPIAAPEYYAYQAKSILRTSINSPSADTLFGIVLVAFIEYRAGRKDGLGYYAQAAANMANAIRPADEMALDGSSATPLHPQQLALLRTIATQLFQLAR